MLSSTPLKLASFVFCIPTGRFLCFLVISINFLLSLFRSFSLPLHRNARFFVSYISFLCVNSWIFIVISWRRTIESRIGEERKVKGAGRKIWKREGGFEMAKKISPFVFRNISSEDGNGWGRTRAWRKQEQRNRGLVESADFRETCLEEAKKHKFAFFWPFVRRV